MTGKGSWQTRRAKLNGHPSIKMTYHVYDFWINMFGDDTTLGSDILEHFM